MALPTSRNGEWWITQQLKFETCPAAKENRRGIFINFLTLTSTSPKKKPGPHRRSLFITFGEPFFPDIRATQSDVEHALHCAQNLLVGSGGTLLHLLDDGGGGVAFGREFLLCHFVGLLIAALLDSVCHSRTDGLGLDDVIAAVDLCQVLAFATAWLGGLWNTVNTLAKKKKKIVRGQRTALPVAYFFSVPTTRPWRWAAFKALLPRTVVSRGAPPPVCFWPMRVTESQSLMVNKCEYVALIGVQDSWKFERCWSDRGGKGGVDRGRYWSL